MECVSGVEPGKTNSAMQEGIALPHRAVVFNPMSHVGTNTRQAGL
jgi:hypothetical protein